MSLPFDASQEDDTKEYTLREQHSDRKRLRTRREANFSMESVESAVDRIMTRLDLGEGGLISYEEFKLIVQKNQRILATFERCFHQELWAVAGQGKKSGKCCGCVLPRATVRPVRSLTAVTEDSVVLSAARSGWTYKKLKGSAVFDKVYLVQRGNILYEYSAPSQALPEAVVFLEGCYIEPTFDVVVRSAYGLSISHQNERFRETTLFFGEKRLRDEWMENLREVVSARHFDQYFHLQNKIGMGKFSEVYTALEKETGDTFAVKIIDKRILNDLERELMRSELAILKLLNHPNVVHLFDIFDERHKTYVVMELVPGGELFEYLRKNRVNERFAQHITKQLFETVKYLHEFGVIHRDIKPENILMSDHSSTPSIVLTDFGLSKLVGPRDKLQVPCGTLSYVAPEVLSMNGYNREVDIWSVGVVGYLMISGHLPFLNKDKRGLMDMIKEAEVDFMGLGWGSVSVECLDFFKKVLTRDVGARLSAEEALRHPWLQRSASSFDLTPIQEAPVECDKAGSERAISRPEVMSMILSNSYSGERGQEEGAVEVRLQSPKA